MAITAVDPIVLMREGLRAPYAGDLLTLGKQQVQASRAQIEQQAARLQYPLRSHELDGAGSISDDGFFKALGFETVSSVDATSYEGATFLHDLNDPVVPPELEARFDVVIDRGTSEHVFHLPNLLCGVAKMLKPGGRVIHYVPSSNHIDHGFYMFSPALFFEYYKANGFDVPTLWLIRQPWLRARPRVEVFEYTPGCLELLNHGGLDSRGYQLFCVAVQGQTATQPVIPQQGRYTELWSRAEGPAADASATLARRVLKPVVARVRSTLLGDLVWDRVINPVKKRVYFRRQLRRVLEHQI